MYKIFDTHTHYDDEKYNEDREALIIRVHESGVERIINVGADLEGSVASCELADEYDFVYAAVGAHPYDAEVFMADPESYKAQLRELCGRRKTVAVGEIGLDYTSDVARETQIACFREQMRFAVEMGKPVIIHNRDAHADTLMVLHEFAQCAPNLKGVVHCYSGSAEMAREILEMGYCIAFGGVVTFKNAKRAIEAAAVVPDEYLLIETDCPYLAPTPHRGERNDSAFLPLVIQRLAEIRGTTGEHIAQITMENAKRLFCID